MKSFLSSLAARAHGLADVVQPRPRALFEPDAPGDAGAVADVADVPADVPVRTAARAVAPAERLLTRRFIEIEHLLAATPPAPAPVGVAVPPDIVRPAAESVASIPAVPPGPEPSSVVAAAPVPPQVSAVAPAKVQPVVPHPRAASAPEILPGSVPAPGLEPAPVAPPSITIRIERIDVRAVPPATPIARTIAAVRRANARPSLGDYLAARQ